MSIFSKLLKRGPDEGGAPSGEPHDAGQPASTARVAGPAPATPARPASVKNGAPASEPKAAPARGQAPPPAGPAGGPSKPAAVAPAAAPAAARPGATRAAAAGSASVSPAAAKPGPAAVPARAARAAGPEAAPRAKVSDADGVPAHAQPATGSVDLALDRLFPDARSSPPAATSAGASTASDLEAVKATFEELAVGHSAEVRNVLMEVRWGEARTSWLELARPALRSLRAMAGQVEHVALVAALDGFAGALDEALRPGAAPVVGAATRDKLLAAYAPLVTALPRAFELQGERERREPLVVRALLGQVAGLEPLMLDRLLGAGLGRLEALLPARADEMAAVAGLPDEVAAAVVARVQAWRRATPAALSTPDPAATSRELAALVTSLDEDHRAFEDAARGWSEADRAAKKRLRRRREITFLQITIALARLGEVELALDLEKLPFARRLEDLARLVSRMPAAPVAAAPEAPIRRIDRDSGAHAAH